MIRITYLTYKEMTAFCWESFKESWSIKTHKTSILYFRPFVASVDKLKATVQLHVLSTKYKIAIIIRAPNYTTQISHLGERENVLYTQISLNYTIVTLEHVQSRKVHYFLQRKAKSCDQQRRHSNRSFTFSL